MDMLNDKNLYTEFNNEHYDDSKNLSEITQKNVSVESFIPTDSHYEYIKAKIKLPKNRFLLQKSENKLRISKEDEKINLKPNSNNDISRKASCNHTEKYEWDKSYEDNKLPEITISQRTFTVDDKHKNGTDIEANSDDNNIKPKIFSPKIFRYDNYKNRLKLLEKNMSNTITNCNKKLLTLDNRYCENCNENNSKIFKSSVKIESIYEKPHDKNDKRTNSTSCCNNNCCQSETNFSEIHFESKLLDRHYINLKLPTQNSKNKLSCENCYKYTSKKLNRKRSVITCNIDCENDSNKTYREEMYVTKCCNCYENTLRRSLRKPSVTASYKNCCECKAGEHSSVSTICCDNCCAIKRRITQGRQIHERICCENCFHNQQKKLLNICCLVCGRVNKHLPRRKTSVITCDNYCECLCRNSIRRQISVSTIYKKYCCCENESNNRFINTSCCKNSSSIRQHSLRSENRYKKRLTLQKSVSTCCINSCRCSNNKLSIKHQPKTVYIHNCTNNNYNDSQKPKSANLEHFCKNKSENILSLPRKSKSLKSVGLTKSTNFNQKNQTNSKNIYNYVTKYRINCSNWNDHNFKKYNKQPTIYMPKKNCIGLTSRLHLSKPLCMKSKNSVVNDIKKISKNNNNDDNNNNSNTTNTDVICKCLKIVNDYKIKQKVKQKCMNIIKNKNEEDFRKNYGLFEEYYKYFIKKKHTLKSSRRSDNRFDETETINDEICSQKNINNEKVCNPDVYNLKKEDGYRDSNNFNDETNSFVVYKYSDNKFDETEKINKICSQKNLNKQLVFKYTNNKYDETETTDNICSQKNTNDKKDCNPEVYNLQNENGYCDGNFNEETDSCLVLEYDGTNSVEENYTIYDFDYYTNPNDNNNNDDDNYKSAVILSNNKEKIIKGIINKLNKIESLNRYNFKTTAKINNSNNINNKNRLEDNSTSSGISSDMFNSTFSGMSSDITNNEYDNILKNVRKDYDSNIFNNRKLHCVLFIEKND